MGRSTTRVSRDRFVRLGAWCLTVGAVEFVKVWGFSSQCIALCLTVAVPDDAVEVKKETRTLYFFVVSSVRYLLSEQPVYEVQFTSHETTTLVCAVQSLGSSRAGATEILYRDKLESSKAGPHCIAEVAERRRHDKGSFPIHSHPPGLHTIAILSEAALLRREVYMATARLQTLSLST